MARTVLQILEEIKNFDANQLLALKSSKRALASEKLFFELVTVLKSPPKKKKESRAARWSRLASEALGIAQELKEIQDEFESWKDNLSENLQSSPVGEKLEEICGIDLESAVSALEEAEGADVPLGYGRD